MGHIAGNLEAKLKGKQRDWKSKLSGAFNPEQIFFSLAILSIFYIVYTIFNGLSDVLALIMKATALKVATVSTLIEIFTEHGLALVV